jgi:hypothetical protein
MTPPLKAVHPLDGRGLTLPSGQVVFPKLTDWLVMRDGQLIDVCDDAHLASGYIEIQEGTFLSRALCVRIENTTGIGTTRSPEELAKAIERLATIQIGHVKIDFTPGQLSEIRHRAEKRGLSVKQEIERIVDRIRDEIFYRS